MYKNRYLEDVILNLNKSFKVIYLSGPRQVGKTTLLKYLSKKIKINYISLDDLMTRKLAQEDPELFLQKYEIPLFIDEVQYAPQLFPYIKICVDNSKKNGLFWMTGSQQFSIMKNVKESLAGRICIVNLLGFSLAEDRKILKQKFPFLPGTKLSEEKPFEIRELFRIIHKGSFPLLSHRNHPPLENYYNSYIQTYIDRDLRDIFHVSQISTFHKFIQLCAARTGQLLNYSDLARDADISVHASKEWINILASSFQIYLLQPYYKNISKRMIKAPKMYFLDTGLASYLTKWESYENLANGAMAGQFFETFVISEIIKSYWNRGKEAPIYYFRDKEKHEIDLIIEKDNTLYPVEIKFKSNISKKDLRNIYFFRKKYENVGMGSIVSLSKQNIPIDKLNEVIPVWMIT